jgi:transcriptional regulator GlxA family with amidase domain
VLNIIALMEENLEAPPTRATLAARVNLSVRQLERHFVKHLGMSVAHMFLTIRLDHAAHLLRTTGTSVTDVALACGFASSSHFSRAFKAHFGSSPTAQRARSE